MTPKLRWQKSFVGSCVLAGLTAILFASYGRAADSPDAYFMLCPRLVERSNQSPFFSFVFSRIRPESDGVAVYVFQMNPSVANSLTKSLEGGTRDSTAEFKAAFLERRLPPDIATFLAKQLAAAGLERNQQILNPLFPLHHRSVAVELDIPVFYLSNDRSPREQDLIRGLVPMNPSITDSDTLAEAFLKTCLGLGVDVEQVWYISDVNLMVVKTDEDFPQLIKTMFYMGN